MKTFGKLGGEVEVDETFIGGKARNMHLDVKKRRITGTGGRDKTAVMGILGAWRIRSRASSSQPQEERPASGSQEARRSWRGTLLPMLCYPMTDLASEYAHKVVDHAEKYVDGQVHTNGLENFW